MEQKLFTQKIVIELIIFGLLVIPVPVQVTQSKIKLNKLIAFLRRLESKRCRREGQI